MTSNLKSGKEKKKSIEEPREEKIYFNMEAENQLPGTSKLTTSMSYKLVGKLEEYIPGDDLEDYFERVENYFELNEMKPEHAVRKKLILLNYIGSVVYAQLKKLLAPQKIKDVSYAIIENKLKSYYCKTKHAITEHFKFNKRNQQNGEKAIDYAVELQSMAQKCEFGTFLDTALRDRFVAGLRNPFVQQKLLNETPNTTFENAVKIAKTLEMTELDLEVIQGSKLNRLNVNQGYSGQKDVKKNKQNQSWIQKHQEKQPQQQQRQHHQPNNNLQRNYHQNYQNYQQQKEQSTYKGSNFNANYKKYFNKNQNYVSSKNNERNYDIVCFNCSKKGHIAKFCRNASGRIKSMNAFENHQEKMVSSDENKMFAERENFNVNNVCATNSKPYYRDF